MRSWLAASGCSSLPPVDELIITIVPVILGAGTPLFAGVEHGRLLELESTEMLGQGMIQLRYGVAPSA